MAERKALATTLCGIGSMAIIMGVVAWPPRGGASSKSTWWAFGVKLWEPLGVDTHLAPVTLGK